VNTAQKIILVVPLLALSLLANAQEVYKRVQQDGTVEYSDMPFPDSHKIEVDPNVVEVTPERRKQSAPERAEVRQEQRAPEKLEADNNDNVYINNDNVYINNDERDRAKRRAVQEKHQQENNRPRPQPRQGGAAGRRR
jgi:hypothetical protein